VRAASCLHREQLTVTVGLHVSVALRVYMNCTLTSMNWRLFRLPTTTVTCKLRYKWCSFNWCGL